MPGGLARQYAPLVRDRALLYLGLHLLGFAGWVALAYVVHESAWATSERLGPLSSAGWLPYTRF